MRRDVGVEADETVRGSLNSGDDVLDRFAGGADVVIHCAGVVKAPNRGAFFAANAVGAGQIADAAERTRVPGVVHISSLTAREPQLSDYAESKRAGEATMEQRYRGALSIVRPPAIYGPADRELLPVFRAAATEAFLPTFDPARIAMIHVDDAARQIVAIAKLGRPIRTALSDERPQGYSWTELMSAAAEAVGQPAKRLVPLPRIAVQILGIGGDLAAFAGAAHMLTSGKARELLHPNWALAPEERWVDLPPARYGLAEGFAHTVAWYRSAAWMKQ